MIRQDYIPPADATWAWKHVCKVKEVFKAGYTNDRWSNHIQGYSIRRGYDWIRKDNPTQNWTNLVWNNWNIPKHSIITWLVLQEGVNVKEKLFRIGCCADDLCCTCSRVTETTEHLFHSCEYACRIRNEVEGWLGISIPAVQVLSSSNTNSVRWKILVAVMNAMNYHIWAQRNNARMNNMLMRPGLVAKQIEQDIKRRIRYKGNQRIDQVTMNWLKRLGV